MKSILLASAIALVSICSFAQNSKPASDTTKTKNVKKTTTTTVKKDSQSSTTK